MSLNHARRLQDLFSKNPLFKDFEAHHFESLDRLVAEVRHLAPEEYLIREGEEAMDIYVLEQGHVEILMKDIESDTTHALATLGPGECVGEVALLDAGSRSASAKAIEHVTVSVIHTSDLRKASDGQMSLDSLLKVNLAEIMAERMRTSNVGTVKNLQEMLEEAEKRIEMGKFMSRVLIGTCL